MPRRHASPTFPVDTISANELVSVGPLETLSLRPIGSLYVAAAGTVISPPFSVEPAFGNVLPPVWGVLVVNRGSVALDVSDNLGFWRGVEFEVS